MPLFLNHRRLIALAATLILSALSPHQALASEDTSTEGTISAAGSTNNAGPTGIIPITRGLNASLVSSTQHDSSNGWSTVETPGIAYRFNRLFSINAAIPVYASINIDQTKGTRAKPIYLQTVKHGVPGDLSIAGQFTTQGILAYSADLSFGLPTGNTSYGLGAGQPTYDFNNHFETGLGIFTPDIELGIGDSSNLIGTRIRKSYTAVGTLAHFQAGAAVDLPFNMSFEADAYEELPVRASTLYSTTGKGKKKVTSATGTSASEDNGITTSLDMPVTGHITLSGFYNRSIRSQDDVVGFSLTFLLRAPPRPGDSIR